MKTFTAGGTHTLVQQSMCVCVIIALWGPPFNLEEVVAYKAAVNKK